MTVKNAATPGISMNIWLMKRPTCSSLPIRREAKPMNVTIWPTLASPLNTSHVPSAKIPIIVMVDAARVSTLIPAQ